MLDRRRFLSSGFWAAAFGVAGLGHLEAAGLPGRMFAQLEKAPASLPDASLYDRNQDACWAELRRQFLIPAEEIYLNNGTVGSSPAPVLRRQSL